VGLGQQAHAADAGDAFGLQAGFGDVPDERGQAQVAQLGVHQLFDHVRVTGAYGQRDAGVALRERGHGAGQEPVAERRRDGDVQPAAAELLDGAGRVLERAQPGVMLLDLLEEGGAFVGDVQLVAFADEQLQVELGLQHGNQAADVRLGRVDDARCAGHRARPHDGAEGFECPHVHWPFFGAHEPFPRSFSRRRPGERLARLASLAGSRAQTWRASGTNRVSAY